MVRHLMNMLRRRVYYLFDSQDSVVHFNTGALRQSIENKLAEIEKIAKFYEGISFRRFTMCSIRNSRIRQNLHDIYHDMNALKHKDPELHKELVEEVDNYRERLKVRKN